MPNGRTHDLITYILSILFIPLVLIFNGVNLNSYVLILSFIFSALMFNGDLDTNSSPYNRWWVFKMIWIPYQLIFTHRSIWTHGFILGTLIRVLYISIIPMLFFTPDIINIINNYNTEFILLLIGLEIGAMSHTIADKLL
jgi:uncharacterized metal-binding protein